MSLEELDDEPLSLRRRIAETESRFRTMANTAPVLLWMAGLDGECDFFNHGWLAFTGRSLDEELGTGWAEGVHPEDFARSMQTYVEAFVVRKPFAMEYRLRRHDGEYRWIYDQGAPRFEADGRFAGFIGSCIDITEQREAREALGQLNRVLEERVRERTALADERETLLREVHHRVKNDLQLISSLLAMHGREFTDGPAVRAFEECQGRVQAIARVHEHMYQSENLAELSFSEHLRGLALEILDTGVAPPGVELVLDLDSELVLGVDHAIPCAMIVHELVLNAFKHAFPDGRRGQVRVTCRAQGGGRVLVSVADDGVGMPRQDAVARPDGLGWTLIDAFAHQLRAELEVDAITGTTVSLSFPSAPRGRLDTRRAAQRRAGPGNGDAAGGRSSGGIAGLDPPVREVQ